MRRPRSECAPPVEGVALVRFGSLGDVILATAAAERLRQARPDLPVAFVTRSAWAPVLFRHPAIRRVIPLADRGAGAGVGALAARLRDEGWRDLIDLHGSLRSRLLTALVRPRRHVVYNSRRLARRGLVAAPGLVRRLGLVPPEFRVVTAMTGAVDRWLGRPPGGNVPAPAVHLAPNEIAWAVAELNRLGVPAGAIGLAPGAHHPTKRWPIGYHAELIDRLAVQAQGVTPVFLSGASEDLDLEIELRRFVRRPEALRVIRQPIRRVAALLGRLGSLVTNDTGLMHLAAAVDTPVVALFGPTVTEFGFRPWGEGHQVLERPLACRPCSLHGGERCPRGHFRCLREVSPEDVLSALGALPRPRPAPGGGRRDITR